MIQNCLRSSPFSTCFLLTLVPLGGNRAILMLPERIQFPRGIARTQGFSFIAKENPILFLHSFIGSIIQIAFTNDQ
jgi:hypothetical protein